MGTLSFHAGTEGKANKNSVAGLTRHTQRKSSGLDINHSNKEIDKALTPYNIDGLWDGKTMDERVKERIENEYKGKRAVRKDHVVLREVIAAPSADFFPENMPIEEKREVLKGFIDDSIPWMMKEFGAENVVGFSGHLDETNPHVHFGIMPMTEDGRISQTEFFRGPKGLKRMHREYRQHMIDKGWDIDINNKYEDFDDVPMPKLKATGKKVMEKRAEHQELLGELKESPDVRQKAEEAVYSDIYEEVLHREREELEEREKALEARERVQEERVRKLRDRNRELRAKERDISKRERRLAEVSEKVNEMGSVLRAGALAVLKGDTEREGTYKVIEEEGLARFKPEGLKNVLLRSIEAFNSGRRKERMGDSAFISAHIERVQEEDDGIEM